MSSDPIEYKKDLKEKSTDSEKDGENSESFTEKVQAGAKAVAAKINNPGTDLNLEYEKGKADDELDV